jgi:uncharacterized protein
VVSARRTLPPVLALGMVATSGLAASCSSEPAATAPARGDSVTVHVGAAAPIRAEVADTPDERARGLMDRDRLPPNTGMVFVFPEPSTSAFYMFHTRIPLSIAFVDGTQVVSVAEMTPCRSEKAADCQLYPADGAYTLAIEAPGGHFTSAGVRPGDPVRIAGDLPTAAE